ncbi:MAG: 23S rRNA (adenine(2503)-C(2))-methyltransferase RlmN [Alphaproteobacteria bacterium]|nr:23S rRNA (adenine(2503)-C(2))-methyltransferase RlmN [Alphaproteobacteria bacterium]
MQELIGLSFSNLQQLLADMGEKPFRAKQLWQWIYNKGVTDFSQMTTLSKPFREKLSGLFTVSHPKIVTEQNSTDKTRKWLMAFADGQQVECVYIPESDRGAVCISTQVGCAQGCKFCHTGTQKMMRNLTAGEIVGQFMAARDSYHEWPTPTDETRYLSNIVVMGMGEPLYNFENLKTALQILMDGDGIAISKRKITVSTCGVADKIPALADLGVKLAVSLHAPTDEIRNKIMPVNRKFPLNALMQACRDYQERVEHRQFITMEYVMLKGVNDSPDQARDLINLVKGLEVKVNLIPFHPWNGSPFEPSSNNAIHRFAKILEDAYIAAPIRRTRGEDIMAACGQLKSEKGTVRS